METTFTKAALLALEPTDKRQSVSDPRTPGLCLRVTPTGAKSFYYVRKIEGKVRFIRIGAFPAATIEQARRRAAELAAEIVAGIDPAAAKQARREEPTVADARALYLTDKGAKLSPRTLKAEASLWKNLSPLFPRKL